MCSNPSQQNAVMRQEIENLFPEMNDPRKTEEQIETAYCKVYENVVECLQHTQLVSCLRFIYNKMLRLRMILVKPKNKLKQRIVKFTTVRDDFLRCLWLKFIIKLLNFT